MYCAQSEKKRRLKQGKPGTFLLIPLRQASNTGTEILPCYLKQPK